MAPSTIIVPGLKESSKPRVCPIDKRSLILFEKVSPESGILLVALGIIGLVHSSSHLGYREVIVGVFQSARNTACHGTKSFIIEILDWDVVDFFPTLQTAATFVRPIEWFYFCVLLNSCVSCFPVNFVI